MPSATPSIACEHYGDLPDGRAVRVFTLAQPGGLRARILEWGCILASLELPGADGGSVHVVLGFDSLGDYLRDASHQGAVVGRFANRIAGAAFELDGVHYALEANAGGHHLHGGSRGFSRQLWRGEASAVEDGLELRLERTSPDGEAGYPGELLCQVIHRLTTDELWIGFRARSDRATLANFAHHPYFDLSGGRDPNVLEHELALHADHYLSLAPGLVPTGERRDVAGSPFDFRTPKPLGRDIASSDPQLALAGGYDHCFVLRSEPHALRPAAVLRHPGTRRELRIQTTQPAMQLYTANSLGRDPVGRSGRLHGRHAAVCLEAQGFPDSPSHPGFPTAVLRPGDEYRQDVVYRFRW